MTIAQFARVFGLTLVVATASLAVRKQAPTTAMPFDVAYVGEETAEGDAGFAALRAALDARRGPHSPDVRLQYVVADGSNIASLRSTLARIAHQRPALVVLPTGDTALAGKDVLGTVPAVFASYLDPVRVGLVQSMNVPGGNLTGVSLADWLCEYRLDLLRRAFPGLRRIAVLADQSWADHYDGPGRLARYSVQYRIDVAFVRADDAEEVDRVMSEPWARNFEAWYFPPTYTSYVAEARIRSHLKRLQRPAMYSTLHEVEQGGQIAYAQDTGFVWSALAELTDRVLAGELPSRIPVQTPRRFALAVRSDASFAKSVPAEIMKEADRVFVSDSR